MGKNVKITIQECERDEEEEVVLRCKNVDRDILKLIYALRAKREKITVWKDEKMFQVLPQEIFYFESVDNHVFAYLEQEVCEVKKKLYELEEIYVHTDFFRASKSTIINLEKVEYLSPGFHGRFEAAMKNGERLVISRQYVSDLKRRLGV